MSHSLLDELLLAEKLGSDPKQIDALRLRYKRRVKKCRRRPCWVKLNKMEFSIGKTSIKNMKRSRSSVKVAGNRYFKECQGRLRQDHVVPSSSSDDQIQQSKSVVQ